MPVPPPDAPLSDAQKQLLHSALLDLHRAREKLRGVAMLQRHAGQPLMIETVVAAREHLNRLWLMLDGLDVKSPHRAPEREEALRT